ncbi:MAG: UDP-N-acetylglucosamine pyrophosphorylase [Oscillospiraceae bacterium]|nr:UDP-N-acetylglucosamine pyrophosphorylase [Oscillospiraceae bacterium]
MSEKAALRTAALFPDLTHTLAAPLLAQTEYPWQALAGLKEFIRALGPALPAEEYDCIGEEIWAAKSACIAPTACINGPAIIGPDTEVRHCAFIRGSALVGAGAVVGNSTELKNVILFDGVQVPHYNYVGDSILGFKSHMGAGAITSNVKSDKTPVVIHTDGECIETGLKKLGAILADHVEVGCGSVLNPGTVIGAQSNVYPLSSVRGFIPAGHIFKAEKGLVKKR